MKKRFLLLAVPLVIYSISCVKASSDSYTCTGPAASEDSAILKSFALSNNIDAVADASGLYYQIIDTGAPGPNPIGKNKITVNYVGKFLSGIKFDSTTSPVVFELDSLIKGWQYGLPKIRPGGHIKLLVPSALGFGCYGNSYIPPNTPLYFDVSLISVGF
jgi:FKBP-type peptidyl-prolyl cis-trans isomerase FkpA